MLEITDDLEAYLENTVQVVRPMVLATWADSRIMDDILALSSEDPYSKTTLYLRASLWWKFHETSSSDFDGPGVTNVEDFSGNGRHGGSASTIFAYGDPGLTTEDDSASYQFKSTSSSSVAIANESILNPTSDFMLELWVNFRNATLPFASSEFILAAKALNSTNSNRQFEISVDSNKLTAAVYVGSTKYSVASGTDIDDSTDYHVALIYKAGTLYLIINGVLIGSTVVTGTINTTAGDFSVGNIGFAYGFIPVANIEHVAFYNSQESRIPTARSMCMRYFSGVNTGTISTNDFFTAEEAGNGKAEPSFPWAVIDSKDAEGEIIKANGKYYSAEQFAEKKKFEYGFWSRQVSDVSGNFTSPVQLYLEFNIRLANVIRIFTSPQFGRIENYDYGYLNVDSDVWVDIPGETMAADNYFDQHFVDDGVNAFFITGLYISIDSTENPEDRARIQELVPIYAEDISDDIISLSVNKVRDSYDSTVPLGITGSNTMDLVLQNADRRYNKHNELSTLFGYIEPELKMDAYLFYPVTTDEDELLLEDSDLFWLEDADTLLLEGTGGDGLVPLGTYWMDTCNADTSTMTASFALRDESKFLQDEVIVDGVFYRNKTASQAIGDLARYGGIYDTKIHIQERFVDQIIKLQPYYNWRFNEGQNSKTAVTLTNQTMGNLHHTASFDSTYGGWSYNMELDSVEQLTVELWIKTSTASGSIIEFEDTAGSTLFKIMNPSVLAIEIGTTWTLTSATAINDNKWHHVAVTTNSGTTDAKIYVDGVVVSQVTGIPFSDYDIVGNIIIGSASMTISLTDIRIWGVERSAQEINDNMSIELMGHEENLTSYWKLHEPLDEDLELEWLVNSTYPAYWLANRSTTSDAVLTVEKCAVFKHRDKCFSGDITDVGEASIACQEGPLFNDLSTLGVQVNDSTLVVKNGNSNYISTVSDWSFSGFVLIEDFPASTDQFVYTGGVGTGAWRIYITDDGDVGVSITSTGAPVATNTGPIQLDTWHHIGVSVHKNSLANTVDIYVYVDGVLLASAVGDATRYSALPLQKDTLYIGNHNDANHIQGCVSEFAIYPKALTAQNFLDIYNSSRAEPQRVYPNLWSIDESVWDAMLNIATPDLGMFFMDEYGDFIYEGGNRLIDGVYPQHTVSQITLNQDDFIISGDEDTSLLINSVSCKVYKTTSKNDTVEAWRAADGESLAITRLEDDITAHATTIPYRIVETGDGTYKPIFPATGYFKLRNGSDTEIIKYSRVDKENFYDCERGQFGTTAKTFASESDVLETRVYEITYNDAPLTFVKYPFITAVIYGYATIDVWKTSSFKAQLVVSANGTSTVPIYILLEGEDPLTNLVNFMAIAGIVPGANTQDSGSEESLTSELKNQIRRFRRKSMEIDNRFIQDKVHAQEIIDFLIAHFKDGASIIRLETLGLPHLQLSDRITVGTFDQMNISNKDYWITGIEISYDGGVSNSLTLREVI
jgi:hypothetical protein